MKGIVVPTAGGCMARLNLLLEHKIKSVWAALTEPKQLVKWLADADIVLVTGGRIQLRFNNTNSVINGQVTAIERPRLLEFTWNSTDAATASLVRWELQQQRAGTSLSLSHFLPNHDHLAEMLAGWHTHLEGLPSAILGQHVAWPWERWHELHALYQAQVTSQLQVNS